MAFTLCPCSAESITPRAEILWMYDGIAYQSLNSNSVSGSAM
jgi:hypothetical protein